MKKLKNVYIIYYVFEFEDGHDDVRLLGVFSSISKAKAEITKLHQIPELHEITKYYLVNDEEQYIFEEGQEQAHKIPEERENYFRIDSDKPYHLGWHDGFITIYY